MSHSKDLQAPQQKRRTTRLRCSYEVQCQTRERLFPVRVVDMSLQGMRLEVPQRLRPGSRLVLTYEGAAQEAVSARVMWCRKKRFNDTLEAGVEYDHADEAQMERTWVHHLMQKVGFEPQRIFDRRKTLRVKALLRSDLRSDDAPGHQLQGTTLNLGVGGALFESPTAVARGTPIRLEVGPYGDREILVGRGRVVQCAPADNGRFHLGIAFEGMSENENDLLAEYIRQLMQEALDELLGATWV